MGGKQITEYGLPQPQTLDNNMFAQIYRHEIEYDQREERTYVTHHVSLLTVDQREVFESFCAMMKRDKGGILFLGGTGKTFLINLL